MSKTNQQIVDEVVEELRLTKEEIDVLWREDIAEAQLNKILSHASVRLAVENDLPELDEPEFRIASDVNSWGEHSNGYSHGQQDMLKAGYEPVIKPGNYLFRAGK